MAKKKALLRKKQPQPRRKQPEPQRKKQGQVSVDDLPLDLVEEILCRLPVKKLIQLRCVCKSWNSLFSENSSFAKKHLRWSTSKQSRHHLFVKSGNFVDLQSPLSTIFTSRDVTMSVYSLRAILKKGESDRDGGGYVSTCDGIICYTIDASTAAALLFNPSIRKFIILPPLEFPDLPSFNILYTLVYDRFINNYKVIARIDHYTKSHVSVYTFGTHHWRRIQDFPSPDQLLVDKYSNFELMCSSTGIFVNDSVNWLTSQFIVSLDLENESYQKLSLPVSNVRFGALRGCLITLGTLRGCLSLLIPMMDTFSDIWIMKEFGNQNSWTKLLSIPYLKAWGRFRYSKVHE
ncbi:hypothetical protein RYX36_033048 [Vicia faba]